MCYDQIGLCDENINIVVILVVNTIKGPICDESKRKEKPSLWINWSLKFYSFCIWTPILKLEITIFVICNRGSDKETGSWSKKGEVATPREPEIWVASKWPPKPVAQCDLDEPGLLRQWRLRVPENESNQKKTKKKKLNIAMIIFSSSSALISIQTTCIRSWVAVACGATSTQLLESIAYYRLG